MLCKEFSQRNVNKKWKKKLWIKVITITIIILSVGPEQKAEYKLELKNQKGGRR